MEKVTKEMGIIEIVQAHPEAAARFENLEAGAKVHGFDADEMVAEINELISK